MQVSDVVEPVGQGSGAVEGEALVQHMKGHVLETVVVQRRLRKREENTEQ